MNKENLELLNRNGREKCWIKDFEEILKGNWMEMARDIKKRDRKSNDQNTDIKLGVLHGKQ